MLAPALLWMSLSVAAPGFWQHWGDGRAELNGYQLTQHRYGQVRTGGTAVTITVTEPFSRSARIKADPGKHPPADELPVLKLNLNEHFQAGIYDYNVMTSAFVAVDTPELMKLTFSAQEWCGHVFESLVPQPDGTARHLRQSYFDGESDVDTREPLGNTFTADELLLSVRGLGRPLPADGKVVLLPRLKELRFLHKPFAAVPATFSSGAATVLKVPAGSFPVTPWTFVRADGVEHRFWVEVAEPRRVIAWEVTGQERAELAGSFRDAYWTHNKLGDEALLEKLGLRALKRTIRTAASGQHAPW